MQIKEFKFNNYLVKYMFYEPKLCVKHLIIIFNSTKIGDDYNKFDFTADYIKNYNSYILWIKDDFYNWMTYYICHKNNFNLEKPIIELIYKKLDQYDIPIENTTLLGTSKGGSAAMYYGLKYDFKNIISSVPQFYIGDFLLSHYLSILNHMIDGDKQKGIILLNKLIPDLIKKSKNKDKNIYLISSPNDKGYKTDIEPFLYELQQFKNFNFVNNISPFSYHHNVVTRNSMGVIMSLLYSCTLGLNSRFGTVEIGEKTDEKSKKAIEYIDNLKSKKDSVANINSFSIKENRLYIGGICFIKGYDCASEDKAKAKLLFTNLEDSSKIEIRTTPKQNQELSKTYYNRYFIDYSFAGFETTMKNSLDLTKIKDGKYSISFEYKIEDYETLLTPKIDEKLSSFFGIDDESLRLSVEENNVVLEKNSNFSRKLSSIKIKEKKDSKTCILVFSSGGIKKGDFLGFAYLSNIKANFIFINDFRTNFYLNGSPDFENKISFENYIKSELNKMKIEKLYTYGYGMGGYGALLYGSSLEADGIIAINTKNHPDLFPVKIEYKKYEEDFEVEISKLKFKDSSNIYLFAGNHNYIDIYSALKINENIKNSKLKVINNIADLNVGNYLHNNYNYTKIVESLFLNQDESLFNKIGEEQNIEFEDIENIYKFRTKRLSKKIIDTSHKNILEKVSSELPNWSLVQFYTSLVFKKEKDFINQEKYLKQSLKSMSRFTEARYEFATMYFGLNKFHEALDQLLVLKEHKFSFACAELLYKTLIKLDKKDEAKNILNLANKLKLNIKQKSMIKKYLEDVNNLKEK